MILILGEYIQMAGRAGRRGLDDDGTVILLCKAEVPELSDLKNMILVRFFQIHTDFQTWWECRFSDSVHHRNIVSWQASVLM